MVVFEQALAKTPQVPEVGVVTDALGSLSADVLVIMVQEGCQSAEGLRAAFGERLAAVLDTGDFRGRASEMLWVHLPDQAIKRILLVGAGSVSRRGLEALREAAGCAARCVRDAGLQRMILAWPSTWVWSKGDPGVEAIAEALAEGALLSVYRLDGYRTRLDEGLNRLEGVLVWSLPESEPMVVLGVERARVVAESVAIARTLILHPGGHLPPLRLASEVRRLCEPLGLNVRVLDREALKAGGYGAILAVAQGSHEEPCLIEIEYQGSKEAAPIALIGKGITFDSGGIGIKPSKGMEKMKYDKAGGAAVIATIIAAARLGVPWHIVGVVAAAENMPSETAARPGDVITTLSGLTVEFNDTDAEGRMVLADALTHALRHWQPQAVIDAATLTGTVTYALGRDIMGVMGNHEELTQRILEAGERGGDRGWPLPLDDTFDDMLKSEIADLLNYPGSAASCITAGSFLKQFINNTPWVHLDIAGVAWAPNDSPHRPKGPTGAPIRMLLELLGRWRPLAPTH
jgi:leucyl aminopeptidase